MPGKARRAPDGLAGGVAGTGHPPGSRWRGRAAGVRVVTNLYDGSLSDGPPADSYLNLMRHNVRTIVEALR
jgi:hypothetical protein